jgi:hypothetical protein
MSGKSNKARRKQERLRQRRAAQRPPGEPGKRDVCPLYRIAPQGAFYSSWVDCGSQDSAIAWADAVMQDQRAAEEPDVRDWAGRMPYLEAIYGRMVPAEAAYQLDRYIDQGSLPVEWAEGGPVTMMPPAQMVPFVAGGPAAEVRAAIHGLHAQGHLVITDDGTVIPVEPAQPDLTDDDEFYYPAWYRLARTARPMTRAAIIKRHGARGNQGRGRQVSGITWNREEFLALAWVEDYLPADDMQDPRGQICERYGERIPADLAVLDMAAGDTAVIAVANAPRSYVHPDRLRTFTGLDDVREALHRLYDDGLLVPLGKGLVLAPGLVLERSAVV